MKCGFKKCTHQSNGECNNEEKYFKCTKTIKKYCDKNEFDFVQFLTAFGMRKNMDSSLDYRILEKKYRELQEENKVLEMENQLMSTKLNLIYQKIKK